MAARAFDSSTQSTPTRPSSVAVELGSLRLRDFSQVSELVLGNAVGYLASLGAAEHAWRAAEPVPSRRGSALSRLLTAARGGRAPRGT
jgi:hypothetical protein